MTKEVASGRPLNAEASAALKAAALRLIRESGYDKVTIAAIAKEAGVARQTLYNRWNTKAELVLEAVFEETHNYAADPMLEAAGDCRALLENFLIKVFQHLNVDGDILRALIAAAQQDRAFQDAFLADFVQPRERMMTALLHHAQEHGELSPNRDPEVISAMVHGAFWYRLLNRKPLDADYARAIVSEILDCRAPVR